MFRCCSLFPFASCPYRLINAFDFTGDYEHRTPSVQGGFQAAGIAVSLGMALAGGAIVGEREREKFGGREGGGGESQV